MNAKAPTRAELTATLIVDGALRMIAGNVQGKLPVEGVPLHPDERTKLGIDPNRMVIFYAADEDGVFFDMGGSTATAWFNGGDCSRALGHFDKTLKRAYPKARQVEDVDSPVNREMRSRIYQVELGEGRIGMIDVAYPKGGGKAQFAVRVFAQQRQR